MSYKAKTWQSREGAGLNKFTDAISERHLQLLSAPERLDTGGTPYDPALLNRLEIGSEINGQTLLEPTPTGTFQDISHNMSKTSPLQLVPEEQQSIEVPNIWQNPTLVPGDYRQSNRDYYLLETGTVNNYNLPPLLTAVYCISEPTSTSTLSPGPRIGIDASLVYYTSTPTGHQGMFLNNVPKDDFGYVRLSQRFLPEFQMGHKYYIRYWLYPVTSLRTNPYYNQSIYRQSVGGISVGGKRQLVFTPPMTAGMSIRISPEVSDSAPATSLFRLDGSCISFVFDTTEYDALEDVELLYGMGMNADSFWGSPTRAYGAYMYPEAIIDLTSTFGEGNEPSRYECEMSWAANPDPPQWQEHFLWRTAEIASWKPIADKQLKEAPYAIPIPGHTYLNKQIYQTEIPITPATVPTLGPNSTSAIDISILGVVHVVTAYGFMDMSDITYQFGSPYGMWQMWLDVSNTLLMVRNTVAGPWDATDPPDGGIVLQYTKEDSPEHRTHWRDLHVSVWQELFNERWLSLLKEDPDE